MFGQFFSIGVMILAIVATVWNTFVYTFFFYGEKYYVFVFRDHHIFYYAITGSELKLFVILFTITCCGTFGIRRVLCKRALRRRESSE